MDKERILMTKVASKLPDGFYEGQALDITHRTADLYDGNIDTAVQLKDSGLYLIGDMRYNLHGSAEILSPPLFGDDRVVNASSGVIVFLGHDRSWCSAHNGPYPDLSLPRHR